MRRFNHLQRVLSICIVVVLCLGCVLMGLRQQALSDMGLGPIFNMDLLNILYSL